MASMKVSFAQLHTWMSHLTEYWYSERMDFDTHYKLYDASISKKENFLIVTFLVFPTYIEGEPASHYVKNISHVHNRYTIIIRCWFINKFIPDYDTFLKMREKEKREIIEKILAGCPVQYHSDDPSYLYQGMWKRAQDQGLALYRFPPLPDKGKWAKRHGNQKLFLTKHIGQLSFEYKHVASMVSRVLRLIK
jgi:hypothetical protein